MVESCLNQLRYSHVKRESNKIAHNPIRYTEYTFGFVVWIENVLPHCFPVFQADLAGIT